MASRCEDGTVTGDFVGELPNVHIDPFSELEEHSGRFEVNINIILRPKEVKLYTSLK